MLLLENLAKQNYAKNVTKTLAHGYSFESTQQELLNKYEHGRVWKVFKTLVFLWLGGK